MSAAAKSSTASTPGALAPSDAGREEVAGRIGAERTADASMSAWLDMVARLLDVPAGERAAIRSELHDHMRERVRDLLVSGESDAGAVSRAIAELGDAAELAGRYRAVGRRTRRRLAMNILAMGVVGAAVAGGLVAGLSGRGPQGAVSVTMFEGDARANVADLPDVRVTTDSEMSWSEFLEHVSKQSKLPASMQWHRIGQHVNNVEVAHDQWVGVELKDVPLTQALDVMSATLGLSGASSLAARVRDGRLVISTAMYFDELEATLATYDLTRVLEGAAAQGDATIDEPAEVIERVRKIVQALVEPDNWVDNGGSVARMEGFGPKLFISAPPRMHQRIEFILKELATIGVAAQTPANVGDRFELVGEGNWLRVELAAADSGKMAGFIRSVSEQAGLDARVRTDGARVEYTPPSGLLNTLVTLLDQPMPASLERPEASTVEFRPKNLSPVQMRDLLGEAMNVSPRLKQCAVGRVMEVNDGVLRVTSTPEQAAEILQIASIIDEGASRPAR
ncbi:MAG: hypothetical protein SFY69_01015 [Planctomycetota bacterium]|nr:hypothetical protein [Planctomycetota bacterium]